MKERKKSEIFHGKEWYRERIIEMVRQIDDWWILKQVLLFIQNITA